MIATFESQPMDQVDDTGPASSTEWIWNGYLARGNVTLLTSQWKAGKTTLLTGLLRQLGAGGRFLGRECSPARALVVSEESRGHWAHRLRTTPVGAHAHLMTRPFRGRPTAAAWEDLTAHASLLREAGQLDVFVVDTLASFLPGSSESDPGTLLAMLQPVQRLAAEGVGALVLHHPRRQASAEGNTARGSGVLLGFVDIILELHRVGGLRSDQYGRRLAGASRYPETPPRLYYQWDPATGAFQDLTDPHARRFRDNWPHLRALLAKRTSAATHRELLADWPAELERPAPSVLYEWLNRATEEKLVRRSGNGIARSPYRYRLPNENDEYHDRGELPPLRELPPLFGRR